MRRALLALVILAAGLRAAAALTPTPVYQIHFDGWHARLDAAALTVLGPRKAQLALSEGRYHQVRRMFAAVGNHVETLHRVSVGGLTLGDLPVGEWRALDAADAARIFSATA